MKNKKVWTILFVSVAAFGIFGISGISPNMLLFLLGVSLLIFAFRSKGKATPQEALPSLTKKREEAYLASGMTPREIEIFRETLNQTKKQIDRLQDNVQRNTKLKAIDLRHDTLRAAKGLFKELVKEPTRLHEASHFLYTHLPNMVDLTDKYIEINAHEVKSRETYEKMEESVQIIGQLASLITCDYQQFVADDLDDLDVELSIAKQSLKRDNRYSQTDSNE
ncbi:5-bromo-4-chloroindolyl phosphate hydrolysis family protein [Enterococcus sp. LJL98]